MVQQNSCWGTCIYGLVVAVWTLVHGCVPLPKLCIATCKSFLSLQPMCQLALSTFLWQLKPVHFYRTLQQVWYEVKSISMAGNMSILYMVHEWKERTVHGWNTPVPCLKYASNTHGICLYHAQNTNVSCIKCASFMPIPCMEHEHFMHEPCIFHTWNLGIS